MCVWTNVPAAVDPQEGDLVILRGDLHDNSLCTALGAAALAYCADALGEHVGAHVAWQQMIEGREKEVEREREKGGGGGVGQGDDSSNAAHEYLNTDVQNTLGTTSDIETHAHTRKRKRTVENVSDAP